MNTYKAHPAAEVFPLMPIKDFTILTDSIKRNGQNKAIELLDGLIIDGRDRQRACEAADVIPIYTDIQTDDPIEYVLVCNDHRKHYTIRQRAAIAADLATLKMGDNQYAKEGISNDTPSLSIKDAANKMGVGTASVARAKKLKAKDPEAHEAAKRGDKVVKPKAVKRVSWTGIAIKNGLLPMTAGGVQKRKLKNEILGVDNTLEFPPGGLKPDMAARVLSACQVLIRRNDPLGAKAKADRAVALLPDDLPKTAKQKLDSAIRAHIRVLDAEAEWHLQQRLTTKLNDILPKYSKSFKTYKEFVNRYKGIFSEKEYKMLIGLLHSDKLPNMDDVLRARYDKCFNLVLKNKDLLCGLSKKHKITGSLPSTVAEMMAMRK